jgi:hypothetical protein
MSANGSVILLTNSRDIATFSLTSLSKGGTCGA